MGNGSFDKALSSAWFKVTFFALFNACDDMPNVQSFAVHLIRLNGVEIRFEGLQHRKRMLMRNYEACCVCICEYACGWDIFWVLALATIGGWRDTCRTVTGIRVLNVVALELVLCASEDAFLVTISMYTVMFVFSFGSLKLLATIVEVRPYRCL